MCVNKLILGDNLDILKAMESESVELIYLDPPFFSNRDYEVIWGDEGEVRSFRDRWEGGMSHYIAWLKERVTEMYRILKPTGSIFLHCDWHADAYIRVEILDRLFGMYNFRGDIVWQRTNAHNDAKKKLAVLSDTIWYYSKTDKFTYNPIYAQLSEAYKSSFYKFEDERGAWQSGDLTGSGTRSGESGQEWRGYNPTNSNRHWAIPVKPIEDIVGKAKASRLTSVEKLELLLENNYTAHGNILSNCNGLEPVIPGTFKLSPYASTSLRGR